MSLNTILATAPLTTTNYILKATGTTIGNSLIWDNGTNVGIGNQGTTYTLDVSGTGRFTGALIAGATTLNGNLEFASGYFINMPWASDTRTMWERYNSATYFQRISSNGTLRQLRLESNGAYGNASIVLDGQSNSTVTTSITSDITYVSGKLGIGITSPAGLLSLKAEVTNTPTVVFQNSLGGPNSAISNFTSAAQTYTVIGTNAYVTNTANIGRFSASYAGSYIAFDEGNLIFGNGTSSVTPSSKMSLNSTGVLFQVGTTYSGTAGDWIARIKNASTTGYGLDIQAGNGSGNTALLVRSYNGGVDFLSIRGDGMIYLPVVYNNSMGAARTTYIQSDGQLGGISSIRASKKNIENLSNVDWLYQLNPVTFNYRKKDNQGNYTEEASEDLTYGLIAEDTQPIADFLINYDESNEEKKMIGIEYSRLITPMLKAIQEMNTKLDEQNQTIQSLQEQINILAK